MCQKEGYLLRNKYKLTKLSDEQYRANVKASIKRSKEEKKKLQD